MIALQRLLPVLLLATLSCGGALLAGAAHASGLVVVPPGKALSYSGLDFAFRYKGVPVQTFVQRPEFAACTQAGDSAGLWSCRDRVWVDHFRGKTVDGVTYDAMTFQQAFFQPFFAGQTFGLGQISPLTALEVTDLVNKVSGYDRLTPDHPQAIYRDVMDPDR